MESLLRILDLLLPRRCVGCGKKGVSLCGECTDALPRAVAAPLDCEALFDYNHKVVRRAVWRLKYRGDRTLAEIFGKRMAEEFLEEHTQMLSRLAYGGRILLIPVPSTRKRYFERGYNQAELIARALAQGKTDVWEPADVLYKIRDNQRQTTLKDRIEREKNVSDIIAVKDKHLTANRICVVVDDVITTGATMRACMGALKKSGARAVYGIAVAHGEKMW